MDKSNQNTTKINLLDINLPELNEQIQGLGHKPFRAKQVWQWLHQKNITEIGQIKNFSQNLINSLNQFFYINCPQINSIAHSRDGSIKFVFDIDDKNAIESVLIPEKDRLTLCISTQAGCAMACTFCATGDQGFSRQLTTGEIISQLWYVNKYLHQQSRESKKNKKVTNIVLMGMGEPLANYKSTVNALRIFLDDNAYGLSKRRVTVSTCGLTSAILQLANDCPVSLAVSLHAPNDQLRTQLMPVNKRYPINELISACKYYIKSAPRVKILIEYVLIKDINDSFRLCDEFANLIKNLNCKVNLIPFNQYNNSKYLVPEQNQVIEFANHLISQSKKTVIIRKNRGSDICGACGQLTGKINDIRRKNNVLDKEIKNIKLIALSS